MTNHPSPQVFGPAINRFSDVMAHHDMFAFKGLSRLAREAGVSASALSKLMNGKVNPSFIMVARLTGALERHFGFHIDPRDLIAEDGRFINRYVCDVVACRGCLPDSAWAEEGGKTEPFVEIQPGKWMTSRYPSASSMPGGRS